MLTVMVVAGVALGIVLLAVRIVIGWVSKPAAATYDRTMNAIGKAVFQAVIVGAACLIVAAAWAAFRG